MLTNHWVVVSLVFAFICTIENVEAYRVSGVKHRSSNLFRRSSMHLPVQRFHIQETPSSSALFMSTASATPKNVLKSFAAVCTSCIKLIVFTIRDMLHKVFSVFKPPSFSLGGQVSEAQALENYRKGLIAKKMAAEKLKEENKLKAIAAKQAQPVAAISLASSAPVVPPPAVPTPVPVVQASKAASAPAVAIPAPAAPVVAATPTSAKAQYDAKIRAKKSFSPF